MVAVGSGSKWKAIVAVILIFLLILFTGMVSWFIYSRPELTGLPDYTRVALSIWAVIILAVMVLTKKDFSRYGVTLQKYDDNMKAVAVFILALPLAAPSQLFFNMFNFSVIGQMSFWVVLLIVMAILFLILGKIEKYGLLRWVLNIIAVCFLSLFCIWVYTSMTFTDKTISAFITYFIFVGPMEELMYRGYVQSRLNEAFGRPYQFFGVSWGWGLVISTLLSALWHVMSPFNFNPLLGSYVLDWGWGLQVLTICLLMGFIREKTGSIAAPAIIHGILDFSKYLPFS